MTNNAELPDFDKMIETIQRIKDLSVNVSKLDTLVKYEESLVFRRGKEEGMAINLIENAYKFPGFDDKLLPLRAELAVARAELEEARHTLEMYKSMVDVWRTFQASERLGLQ